MAKKSFLLYTDRLDILDELSDEDAGKLFKSVVEYVKNGSEPPRGTLTSIAFRGIKNGIDIATDNYERLCLKNRENGKKGGRPKGAKKPAEPNGFEIEPKKPNGYFGFEKETQKTLNDNDNDTKIDDDDENKRACARKEALIEEIKGSIDRLCESGNIGTSAKNQLDALIDREINYIVVNKTSVAYEQFLKTMLELFQAAERDTSICYRILLSITDTNDGTMDGRKITSPVAYLSTALYNLAMIL